MSRTPRRRLFDPTVKGEDGFTWFHRNAAVRRALIDRLRCFVTQDTGEDAVFLEDDLPEVPRTEPHNQTVGAEALADMLQLKAKAEQSADIYLRPRENNVLGSLQQAVLEDDPNALPQTVADDDDSFLIVRAPNAVREVQTLCDWIASMIEASAKTDEPLKASDFFGGDAGHRCDGWRHCGGDGSQKRGRIPELPHSRSVGA